jgi:transcriptional regulator with XRE-family HTH domain
MTTQQELLAALRGRYGDSQTAIADAMQITLARLNNYVRGIRAMDDDAVIAACALLGWSARKYLAKHRAEHARTARAREFWKGWGTAALLFLVALPWANPAVAYSPSGHEQQSAICIMRSLAAFIRRLFRSSRGTSPAAMLA